MKNHSEHHRRPDVPIRFGVPILARHIDGSYEIEIAGQAPECIRGPHLLEYREGQRDPQDRFARLRMREGVAVLENGRRIPWQLR